MRPTKKVAYEGDQIIFKCDSYYAKKTYWTYSDGPLPNNAMPYRGLNLVIVKVKFLNHGFYQCHGLTKDKEIFLSEGFLDVLREFNQVYSCLCTRNQ